MFGKVAMNLPGQNQKQAGNQLDESQEELSFPRELPQHIPDMDPISFLFCLSN